MKKNLRISLLMTPMTTVLLGIIYPWVVTVLAQWWFPRRANGELIRRGVESGINSDRAAVYTARILPVAAIGCRIGGL